MHRKLFIIRHSKSSWESIVEDIDRPLTEKGIKNTYLMAGRLKEAGEVPAAIYSSPANRALHTASIMAHVWEIDDHRFHVRNNLYLPDIRDIIEVVSEIPDSTVSVAVYGHNPGFEQFVNHFMDQPIEKLPTTGVAIVTLELDSWKDILNATSDEVVLDCPGKK